MLWLFGGGGRSWPKADFILPEKAMTGCLLCRLWAQVRTKCSECLFDFPLEHLPNIRWLKRRIPIDLIFVTSEVQGKGSARDVELIRRAVFRMAVWHRRVSAVGSDKTSHSNRRVVVWREVNHSHIYLSWLASPLCEWTVGTMWCGETASSRVGRGS